MPWTSFSDFINEVTSNGKSQYSTFMKVSSNGAVLAAGRWAEFYTATGIPAAGSESGAAGTGVAITSGGINLPTIDATDTRHILTVQGFSPEATFVPAVAILCDFLAYYPALVCTGAPTALTGVALPRYTNGNGVMGLIAVQSALGAASPGLTFNVTFDDDSNGAVSEMLAPANSLPVSALLQYRGTPFIPLTAGKKGIKDFNSYSISSNPTTGTVCAFLVKPLLTIPILAVNTATERDLLMQMPSLPQVYDEAHLAWLVQVGGAMATNTPFGGFVGMGWG